MKLIVLLSSLLLIGCASTSPKFPALPAELSQPCPELAQANPDTRQLSTLLEVVVENYGQYYQCRAKVDSFIKWHSEQQAIYNEAIK